MMLVTHTDLHAGNIDLPGETSSLEWLCRIAVVSALVFAICLAWSPIGGSDMGYHLAYGDTFLETGKIVDSDNFLYVRADPAKLDVVKGNRPPGAWIDSTDRYRFPNANYGSQIVMSLIYRAGGFTGLCLLQTALVALLMAICTLTMRRLGIGTAWIALGIVLISMVGFMRFHLRPEVFGYVFLATIALLVLSPTLTRRGAIALIAVHWVAIQFHSYWVLGLFLVAASWIEEVISWHRGHRQDAVPLPAGGERLQRLTIALGGMIVVSLLNPWTWRLAVLPFQTILFLSANEIPADPAALVRHPWATISEFLPPFRGSTHLTRPIVAYLGILGLTALGAAAAVRDGRWARLAVMAFMVAISLKMRRNLAPAAVILVPLALASIAEVLRTANPTGILIRGARWARAIRVPVSVAVIAFASYWTVSVVTDHFYYDQRSPTRFGAGHSSLHIPVDASRLLSQMPGNVRVFTSFNLSSTVMYFGREDQRFRQVPILTNTWAYPAITTLALNMKLRRGRPYRQNKPDYSGFFAFAAKYDVGIVMLDCSKPEAGLATFLLHNGWQWVHFDVRYLILLRPDLEFPEGLREKRSLEKIIDDIRRRETLAAYPLFLMARSFSQLGMIQQAEQCSRACVEHDPSYREAWYLLGRLLYNRGIRQGSTSTLIEARDCLREATRKFPKHPQAVELLDDLEARFPEPSP